MENDNLTLNEIHECSLELIKFFHNFCHNNNLHYYLAYGTLLGCIRHNGFIPWDDDIDVWMLRNDFEKIIQLFKKTDYQVGHYKLLCRESASEYDYPIIRITDLNYKYIPTDTTVYPDMGTFIDIYPLDSIKNKVSYQKAYKKIKKYNWLYAVKCNWRGTTIPKSIVKIIVHIGIKLFFKDHFLNFVSRKSDSIINQYADEKYDYYGVLNWFTTGKTVYKKACFEKVISHTFEHLELDIPEGYDDLLTTIYGDYHTPPSADSRVQYHNYNIYRRTAKTVKGTDIKDLIDK